MSLYIGQIWLDNYGGFNKVDDEMNRYVAIEAVYPESGEVLIRRVNRDGTAQYRHDGSHNPARRTKASRFPGGKSGFTLVRDVVKPSPCGDQGRSS